MVAAVAALSASCSPRRASCEHRGIEPSDDLPRFSAADRRTLRWVAASLLVVIAGVATLPWTLAIAERLDLITTTAVVVLATAGYVVSRRRRGRGWSGLRIGIALAVVALLAGGALFASCVASGCVH